MEAAQLRCRLQRNRGGYALLLGLLIVVVIGMVIYYMRMHGPVYHIGEGESDINPPWRQWHKMQVRLRKEPLGRPTAEQPQLSKPLEVQAKPVQDGKDRGEIKVVILLDGTVQGSWRGEFFINKDVDFQVMNCRFEGSIDAKQLYSDEEGEDPSMLFFIAKGHFVILETNNDNGRVRNLMGDVYVRGWLGVDNAVSGEIIITSDERNFYLYTWQGWAKEAEPFLLKTS
ncbi:hypothetical protein ES703_33371 [subsurface metagenome]